MLVKGKTTRRVEDAFSDDKQGKDEMLLHWSDSVTPTLVCLTTSVSDIPVTLHAGKWDGYERRQNVRKNLLHFPKNKKSLPKKSLFPRRLLIFFCQLCCLQFIPIFISFAWHECHHNDYSHVLRSSSSICDFFVSLETRSHLLSRYITSLVFLSFHHHFRDIIIFESNSSKQSLETSNSLGHNKKSEKTRLAFLEMRALCVSLDHANTWDSRRWKQ